MKDAPQVADRPRSGELLGKLATHALDVEGVPTGKMFELSNELGWTVRGPAVDVRLIGITMECVSTGRTRARHLPRFERRGAGFEHRTDYGWDHIPCALDGHPITNTNVSRGDIIFVVQGRPLHGHPSD